MLFKKQIIILITQIFFCGLCFAQTDKIDSLKKLSQSVIDTTRVDCFNQLTESYTVKDNKDSAEHYANIAYQEAKRLNYIHGIAVSFCRRSEMVRHFYNDFEKSEALGKESIQWYDRTTNKEGIDDVYYWLTTITFAQSKFEEAIYYAKMRLFYVNKTNIGLGMTKPDLYLGAIYAYMGNYKESFLIAQRGYDYALKTKNKIDIACCLWYLARLYALIDDYPNALQYFRRMWQLNDEEISKWRIANDCDIWTKMEFAEVFSHLQQFDSAWHYYNLFRPGSDKTIYMRVYWVSTGETYFLQKDYRHALQNFQLGLSEHARLNDRNEMMRTLVDISKTYLALNDDAAALRYGWKGLSIAFQTKAKPFIRDGYQILYSVYDHLHQKDSANFYFRKYTMIKEEVLNDQTKAKFAAYNYEQQMGLMSKEKQISRQRLRIQQQQLQHESFQKKIFMTGTFLLFIVGGFILRNIILKRENEKQQLKHELEIQRMEGEKVKAEFHQQSTELEMQALRAQMNPHFIFNSLNSINLFILENNKLQASEYLSKFSRLVRLILQNSQEACIALEKELEALQLYLELEALRFENKFEYKITVDEDIDTTVLKVPPHIIQPYAENAIWHGLMHLPDQQAGKKGYLTIEVYIEKEILLYKISDNGIGRKKAAELKSKSASIHKSMGMRITTDRLLMLQRSNEKENSILITDLILSDGSSGGTEVMIKIPVRYD